MTSVARNTTRPRTIGGDSVGHIGLGCMGLSWAYSPTAESPDRKLSVLEHAMDAGIRLFDTADFYGPHTNEELVGKLLRARRAEAFISTKGGLVAAEDFMRSDGRPEHIRSACDGSLRRLGAEQIDLYQLHRVDPEVPLTETWGAMAELVHQGKVRNLGLCEVTAEQCAAAAAIHPVAAVQSELSIWARQALDDVIPWCRRNGAAFIAFSPLGRGFLTGTMHASTRFADDDFRSRNPRFSPAALAENQRVVDVIAKIAAQHDATPAQVALAWLLAVDDIVLPIPGTTRTARVDENVGARQLRLTEGEMDTLGAITPPAQPRY